MSKKFLVIICGPTAVGKTQLAIDVAKHFNTEIISADSRQFFKEMNVGTAKPSAQQLDEIKHHFINSHFITDKMNTGIFESECIALLEKLFSEKNIVVMAGGTGLYINAVINGVDALPESDEELRQQLQQTITEKGIEALQQQLKFLDEKTYRRIDISNPNRLMRAVEVCLLTGKPYSSFLQREKTKRNFIPVLIGLNTERKILYERINNRVDEMMQKGLIEEVKSFQQFKNYNALQTVGYKELFDYLDGKTTYADAVEMIKKNTRNYAKRQLTWFRKSENIHWFALDEKEKIIFFVEQVLKKNGSE